MLRWREEIAFDTDYLPSHLFFLPSPIVSIVDVRLFIDLDLNKFLLLLLLFCHTDMHDHASFCLSSAIDSIETKTSHARQKYIPSSNELKRPLKKCTWENSALSLSLNVLYVLCDAIVIVINIVASYARCVPLICNVSKSMWIDCSSFSLVL